MAEQVEKTSSGVQDLIDRLRDQGVGAGRSEADRIVAEAREQAAQILAEARREADTLREQTRSDIEKEREAAQQALRLAARDTVLELLDGVARHFEQHVRRLLAHVWDLHGECAAGPHPTEHARVQCWQVVVVLVQRRGRKEEVVQRAA